MKPETKWRTNVVDPFLDSLDLTMQESIQQKCILGTSDKLICCRGKFVALEIKVGKNKLSRNQEIFLDRVENAGGVCLVAHPDTWKYCKYILNGVHHMNYSCISWRNQFAQFIKERAPL